VGEVDSELPADANPDSSMAEMREGGNQSDPEIELAGAAAWIQGSCFEASTYYSGHDLYFFPNTAYSAEACQNLCHAERKCLFFSWGRDDHKCYLKDSDAGEQAYDGYVSGPHHCSSTSGSPRRRDTRRRRSLWSSQVVEVADEVGEERGNLTSLPSLEGAEAEAATQLSAAGGWWRGGQYVGGCKKYSGRNCYGNGNNYERCQGQNGGLSNAPDAYSYVKTSLWDCTHRCNGDWSCNAVVYMPSQRKCFFRTHVNIDACAWSTGQDHFDTYVC